MMKVSQVGNTSIDISIPFKPTHNPTQGIKVCPWHPSTTSRLLCSSDFLWSRFFVTSWIFIIYPTALRNGWVSVTNYLSSCMLFKTMRLAAINLCEVPNYERPVITHMKRVKLTCVPGWVFVKLSLLICA